MPSVRSWILIAVGIFVLTMVVEIAGLRKTPDSKGMGHDSYGTRVAGFKGVYETLEELGVPVKRQLAPPTSNPGDSVLVFLNPALKLTGTEPLYFQNLKPWIAAGGTVVVASHAKVDFAPSLDEATSPIKLPSIFESLGLPDVRFEAIDETWKSYQRQQMGNDYSISEEFLESLNVEQTPPDVVAVECSGSLANWQDQLHHLALPAENQNVLVWDDTEPTGWISYETEEQEERVLAAVFAVGRGRIVVADAGFFQNRFLPMEDNAVAAAYLISPKGSPVIFDEFYHGLSVRGNPLYLLTLPGYLAVVLGILLVIGLMSWRKAILLGPPLSELPQSRRDIGEYITAMGQFFSQGRSSRRFLIEQLRAGVLRELNIAFGLPPESQDVDLVMSLMQRKNPERAKRVRKTLYDAEQLLQSEDRLTEQQTLNQMRRLTACL